MSVSKNTREYKSNSFSLLYKEKKYALELFNYLNNTDYSDPDDVIIVEIEGGISITVSSDSLFIVADYVNIYEHQSTENPNMPLRILIYLAYFYKRYTKGRNIYGKELIRIPAPRVAVFYNGDGDFPDIKELKLSDAFIQKELDPCLELKCTVYNINPGHNEGLKDGCSSIYGYTTYVEKVRRYRMTMEIKDAIALAVDECISGGILSDFFTKNREAIIAGDALDCTFETRLKLQEEEYKRLINEMSDALNERNKALDESNKALDESNKALDESNKALNESNKALAEKDAIIAKYQNKFGSL